MGVEFRERDTWVKAASALRNVVILQLLTMGPLSCLGWLRWLEHCPIEWKVLGLIPGQGT